MIPAPFAYFRPQTLEEAVQLLGQHGPDCKLLAGGHSLVPAMKLRLAQPAVVIDLGRISALNEITFEDGRIILGARVTHRQVECSELLEQHCPLLPETAGHIGDPQVRNRGTVGGSLVHADPAADWPAAMLALDAEFELAGPKGRRVIRSVDFFTEMMQTALGPEEILGRIRVAPCPRSSAYVKFVQRASGFALAGVAVVLRAEGAVAVGVTGVSPKPYRATRLEEQLRGKKLDDKAIAAASKLVTDGVDPLNDIHASKEFRGHLAAVNTRRALRLALSRR